MPELGAKITITINKTAKLQRRELGTVGSQLLPRKCGFRLKMLLSNLLKPYNMYDLHSLSN